MRCPGARRGDRRLVHPRPLQAVARAPFIEGEPMALQGQRMPPKKVEATPRERLS